MKIMNDKSLIQSIGTFHYTQLRQNTYMQCMLSGLSSILKIWGGDCLQFFFNIYKQNDKKGRKF